MIINKILIEQNFKQFLNLSKDNVKTNQSLQLASFAFEIPSVNIADIVGSIFFEKVDSFYWNIDDNIEFCGTEPLIIIKEYGEERLSRGSRYTIICWRD